MSTRPEQHLKVGDWWYLPTQDKLVQLSAEGEISATAELDNLSQKALNYFILNAGRLITRDELLQDVWGVRDVSDGRISRVIRVLRMALDDDSRDPRYIETIPKRGFRFIAPVAEANFAQPAAPEVVQVNFQAEAIPPIRFRPYLWWSAPVALLCCVLLYLSWPQWQALLFNAEKIPLGRFEPLSSMDGFESYPAVSKDGRFLVFSHSTDMAGGGELVLQDLHSFERKAILSSADHFLMGPEWRPDGKALAYQKLKQKESCEIRLLTFGDNLWQVESDTLLATCSNQSFGARMSWSPDGNYLVYPDWQAGSGNMVLMLHPVNGGRAEQLTTPPQTSLGDFATRFSANGEQLVFLRDAAGAAAQIWLLDLKQRSSRQLLQPQGIYPGNVAWYNQDREILYPSGNNSLSAVDIQSGESRLVAYLDNRATEILVTPQQKIYASVGKYWSSDIRKLNNPVINPVPTDELIQQSNRSEALIELNPQPGGPSAVLSGRSGSQQVWLHYPDGKQQQISFFKGNFSPRSLEFAQDGSKLVALVGTSVWLLQANKPAVQLTQPEQNARNPSWSADNQHIYVANSKYGRWQILKIDSVTGEQQIAFEDVDYFRESPDGHYQLLRQADRQELQLKYAASGEVIKLPIEDANGFLPLCIVLRNSAIYILKLLPEDHIEVLRFDITSRLLSTVGDRQKSMGRRFSISYDEQFIYIDDTKIGDLDIAELKLHE